MARFLRLSLQLSSDNSPILSKSRIKLTGRRRWVESIMCMKTAVKFLSLSYVDKGVLVMLKLRKL